MHPQAAAYLNRLRAGINPAASMDQSADWVVAHTRHPKDARKPWSFRYHEFQKAILDCEAAEIAVKKVSQVGLSELIVRSLLAYVSIYRHKTAILTLPTASFAKKFAKTRLDPVIKASELLKTSLSKANDSTELKQIGDSFVHIAGTFGIKAAISIPADFLAHDEVDFSDATVLSNYASRLGHAEPGETKFRRLFSTPTLPNYGISAAYNNSSQGRYAVWHSACSTWVITDFLTDVVIPGYDESLWAFDKHDALDPACRIDEAYLRCPRCKKPIPPADLADPARRQWTHAYPDAARAGFWVQSTDAPAINPISATLRSVTDYTRQTDWINFKCGAAYESPDNSFIAAPAAEAPGPWVRPQNHAATGCVAGIDIGKTSHLLIGAVKGAKTHIIHAERIRQDGDDRLGETVKARMREYGIVKLVVDAAPDFTTAMALVSYGVPEQVWAAQYTRAATGVLAVYSPQTAESVVKIDRSRSLTEAARLHNSRKIIWPACPESGEIQTNLANIKKLARDDRLGQKIEYWVTLGPDHYAHALNYLLIAADMAFGPASVGSHVLALGVSTVNMGGSAEAVDVV